MSSFQTVEVIGVPIARIRMTELFESIHLHIQSNGSCKQICITPVNSLLAANNDQSVSKVYQNAHLVLCDGMPVKWASHLLGNPIPERITGLDLLPSLLQAANKHSYRLFLLGAAPGVGDQLAKYIQTNFPKAYVVGVYVPPYRKVFSEEESAAMLRAIEDANPHIVLVSLTAPKQDIWIAEHLNRIKANWAIGIGGAFEVTAGLIPRAPRWMQQNGLEWLFRFFQEPKRLFKRYFIEAPKFIPLLLVQIFKKYVRI